MRSSIRLWLSLSLTAAIGLMMMVSIGLAYFDVSHETEELYDAELAQISRVLESLLQLQLEYVPGHTLEHSLNGQDINLPNLNATPAQPGSGEAGRYGHKYEKKLRFQIWSRKGVPLLGNQPEGAVQRLAFSANPGFAYQDSDSWRWRTFTLYSEPLAVWIQVAQRMDIREEITSEIAWYNAASLLLLLPVMLLVCLVLIRRGFAPMVNLSRQIGQRSEDHLSPLSTERVPDEIRGLVRALNRLFSALAASIARQRRFTSNAAHELRTPLSAIRIHAQTLTAHNDAQRQTQSRIIEGVDRMTHMVNQLLTLSRIEADGELQYVPVDTCELAESVLQELQPLMRDKLQLCALLCVEPVIARANPESIRILLRNLLDNAIRYTPEQGEIMLSLSRDDQDVLIRVEDTGPGLSDAQKQRVFDRFYRAAGQQVQGCGIGLSIVAEICQRYGYEISLQDRPDGLSGLLVQVRCSGALSTPSDNETCL